MPASCALRAAANRPRSDSSPLTWVGKHGAVGREGFSNNGGLMVKRTIVSVMALAALVLSAVVVPADAKRVPDGQIAFSRQTGSGGADIFVGNSDGSNIRQVPIPYLAEDFASPSWSPDGRSLLISNLLRFDDAGDLLPFRPATVKPDGSDFKLLDPTGAPFDMYCSGWSPDGRRLICGLLDPPGLVSIRSSDGSDPVRLTTNPYGAVDTFGDFSPDGKRFVLVRFNGEETALFTAHSDGSHLRQLTPYGFAHGHEIATAHWSPDGQAIIFATAEGRLFLVHPASARLTPIHLRTGGSTYFAFAPGWSPDGTRIVFSLTAGGQEDIYTARRDGTDLVRITNTPAFEPFADWRPKLRHHSGN